MLRSVFVRDHMTKNPVTLLPDTEILEAAHRLIDNDISGAPVLDKHGRLVGVLTERDCMRVAMQAGYHGEPGGQVKDFMSQNPQWIGPEQSILTLADLFINGRFHRYPVVDNGRLVGVISRRDVMRALGRYYPKAGG
ncbi:MAG: CBS domain-containing protein [Xanthomonadales bacterium]|nr:CBS domain-containing protein [Xanthomonadales bacterium]MDH3941184.1 CBS domain-containing protein [Xanthomonadales bacterium]